MPDPTTTTTLPGGGSVGFTAADAQAAAAAAGAQGGGVPRPATLPNEILGSQSFDTGTTTDAQGNVTGGPGLWTVNLGGHGFLGGGQTNAHALAQKLYALTPAEVEQLQVALYQGGYYDDSIYKQHANPSWGQTDTATQQAYYQAILDASRHPEQTLEQRITSAQDLNRDRLAKLQSSGNVVDLKPDVVNLSRINLSDPATLHAVAQAAGQALLGKDLSPDEVDAFAEKIRGQQRAQGERTQADQRAAAETQASIDRQHAISAAAGPQASSDELAAFKHVLTDEIVGPISAFAAGPALGGLQAKLNQYGISADTMAKWADEARRDGVAVPSLSSPQAVDLVVDHHVKALYATTGGDWNSVATYFLTDVDASMKASRGGLGYGGTGRPMSGTNPATYSGVDAQGRLQRPDQRRPGPAAPGGLAPAGADTYGGGNRPGPIQVNTGAAHQALQPLASHLTTSMAQLLGHAPGQPAGGPGAGTVTGDNTPVFMGGGEQTQIDPQAQAQEAIKREHPEDVFEYSMMNTLRALDSMVGGGRG